MTTLPEKLDKFRFAVGLNDEVCSGAWVIWSHKDEVYAGSRNIAGSIKLSLHGSGICHFGFTRPYWTTMPDRGVHQPAKREFVRWTRKLTPPVGALHVVTLIFPTDHIKGPPRKGEPRKPLYVFPAAPAGQATEFAIFYSKESPSTLECKFVKIGTPLVYYDLGNGESASLVARHAPFEKRMMPTPTSERMRPLNPDALPKPGEELTGLTALAVNDPERDGVLMIIEVGGLTLRRNKAAD
jgi:hypothetical protein